MLRKSLMTVCSAVILACSITTVSAQQTASLASLPDADLVVYINPKRVLVDALPTVMPEAKYKELRTTLDQIQVFAGVDLSKLDYIVAAARFRAPQQEASFPIPEFVLMLRGDFNASALIGMARLMSEGKLKDEIYGTRTIGVIKLEDVAKGAISNPFAGATSELAIAALDNNTLVGGTSSYVKAALDAQDGRGRIGHELVSSLTRNPDVLVSAVGAPVTVLMKSIGLVQGETADSCDCMKHFGEFYFAGNMIDGSLKLTLAIHGNNPTTASILKNLISMGATHVTKADSSKSSDNIFSNLKITNEGSEVFVEADIPQDKVAALIQEQMNPKKPAQAETATEKKTVGAAPKPMARKRRARR